jgi:hypothetical protein
MSEMTANDGAAAKAMEGVPAAQMRARRRPQREILLEVLRIAAQYETWVTLAELADKTRFPPASISAQLRHLRKAEYGAWRVERRRREWVTGELVWEYRLGI